MSLFFSLQLPGSDKHTTYKHSIRYTIISGNIQNSFSIQSSIHPSSIPDSSLLIPTPIYPSINPFYLVSEVFLDREIQSKYILKIRTESISESSFSSFSSFIFTLIIFIIDTNDNTPSFAPLPPSYISSGLHNINDEYIENNYCFILIIVSNHNLLLFTNFA